MMTDAPSDAGVPCHDLAERECKLVKQIEQSARIYDQLEQLMGELVRALQNNDQYFMNHMIQIQVEAREGKKQRDSYLDTLEQDSKIYARELQYMENVIRRAMDTIPLREIRFEDEDPGALTV